MRVLRSCCCIHSCVHLKLICNRMTFYNGHVNTACKLYVHSYGRRSGFLNVSLHISTFIAAVIEFSPDRSLVVTQPRFTWELPGIVATNKAFFMSDFHVSTELKIIRELSRALRVILLLVPRRWNRRRLYMFALSLSVAQVFWIVLGCAFTYLYET